jgi:hypothetical protein
VKKAVEQGVRILPHITQECPDASQLMKVQSKNPDDIRCRSPSKMGISEPVIKSAQVSDPELLVEQFLGSAQNAFSNKIARTKKPC